MDIWQVQDTEQDNGVLYEFRDIRMAEKFQKAIAELMAIDIEISYEEMASLEGFEPFSPDRYSRIKQKTIDSYRIVKVEREEPQNYLNIPADDWDDDL